MPVNLYYNAADSWISTRRRFVGRCKSHSAEYERDFQDLRDAYMFKEALRTIYARAKKLLPC